MGTEPDTKATGSRRVRFSLMTLILLVVFLSGGTGLWMSWAPWSIVWEKSASIMFLSRCVRFSPDGTQVLTPIDDGIDDGKTGVWCARSGREILCLSGHSYPVSEAEFFPDGRKIVTASGDGTARIWDALTGDQLAVLRGHKGTVEFAIPSPSGKTIVTGGQDGTARLWESEGQSPGQIISRDRLEVFSASYSPNGDQIATAGSDRTVRVWNISDQRETCLRGHEGMVFSVAFSPDGEQVASGGVDGTVRVWSLKSGRCVVGRNPHESVVTSVSFAKDGHTVLSASNDGTARIWRIQDYSDCLVLDCQSVVSSASFSADSKRVVTVSSDRIIRIWDAISGKMIAALRKEDSDIRDVAVSPDGLRIASTGAAVRIWHRRRPEYWWGIAWLPEFWIVLLSGGGLLLIGIRNLRKRPRSPSPLPTPPQGKKRGV
ncbi:MAG: WD40 repeat domain-containing protein [Gemmatimonadales bacterium]|nr:MAG: WD40 repeat domain-containing protein [Gemmatimonadales bacterium]